MYSAMRINSDAYRSYRFIRPPLFPSPAKAWKQGRHVSGPHSAARMAGIGRRVYSSRAHEQRLPNGRCRGTNRQPNLAAHGCVQPHWEFKSQALPPGSPDRRARATARDLARSAAGVSECGYPAPTSSHFHWAPSPSAACHKRDVRRPLQAGLTVVGPTESFEPG